MQIPSDTVVEKMIRFAQEHYNEHKTSPTVVNVVETIPELRNVSHFYDYMPDGITELCRRASIPVDYQRIGRTAKATAARMGKSGGSSKTGGGKGLELVLSEELALRIYGACQLAGISDPSELVSMILDRDTEMRLNNLSNKDMISIGTFLKGAKTRKWNMTKEPSILNGVTRFQNAGLLDFSPVLTFKLAELIEVMDRQGVRMRDLGKQLAELIKTIDLLQDFETGRISEDQFKRRFQA